MADSLLGGIVINEILVDPNGALNFDTDGNGTASSVDEYVELYNSSGSAIDISGLEMWDAGVGHWFTFPPGTILQPGGHALVMSGLQAGGSYPTGGPDDLFFDAGRSSALINNGGDNVVVYDPTNDQYILATYNGDALDNPVATYSGFSATATRSGLGEDFGNDTDGLSLQRQGDGADTFVTDGPTPGTTNICFADGTRLMTPQGERLVEHIRVGDLVDTLDHGAQPVRWVFCKEWSTAEIAATRNLAPVLICKGALGPGVPKRDLRVSQQHRIMVRGVIAQRMFGVPEVLVAAKALLEVDGVSLDCPKGGVGYFHIMFDRHEVLFADGVLSESLFLGEQALESIPGAALKEMQAVLDRPLAELCGGGYAPARVFATGKKARRLVARHVQNDRAFLSAA